MLSLFSQSKSDKHAELLAKKGLISLFSHALFRPVKETVVHAIIGLGCLASRNSAIRDAVFAEEVVENLSHAARNFDDVYIRRHVSVTLLNLCGGEPEPELEMVV